MSSICSVKHLLKHQYTLVDSIAVLWPPNSCEVNGASLSHAPPPRPQALWWLNRPIRKRHHRPQPLRCPSPSFPMAAAWRLRGSSSTCADHSWSSASASSSCGRPSVTLTSIPRHAALSSAARAVSQCTGRLSWFSTRTHYAMVMSRKSDGS